MEYTKEIISLISWPILIYITYRLSLFGINIFERRTKIKESTNDNNS